MKKIAYIIFGFAIGALLTYYFCPRPLEMETKLVKVKKPKGVISIAEATELSNNWTKFRKKAVDSASERQGRKTDDQSVSWSLDDVESYLDYAKQQSDSLGYDMTGITVYLGVYGESAGENKKNLSTMFIVPTGKKSLSDTNSLSLRLQGGQLPINPFNKGTGGTGGYP